MHAWMRLLLVQLGSCPSQLEIEWDKQARRTILMQLCNQKDCMQQSSLFGEGKAFHRNHLCGATLWKGADWSVPRSNRCIFIGCAGLSCAGKSVEALPLFVLHSTCISQEGSPYHRRITEAKDAEVRWHRTYQFRGNLETPTSSTLPAEMSLGHRTLGLLLQMMNTRPRLITTLHALHSLLTDARTFMLSDKIKV